MDYKGKRHAMPLINNTLTERVTGFNFLGLPVNEYINWNLSTHKKITYEISRSLGIQARTMFAHSAMKLMYDSFAPPVWNYKLGLLMGSHIKSYRNGPFE